MGVAFQVGVNHCSHQVCFWDVQTHSKVGNLSLGDSSLLLSLAFSSDGSMLSTELSDGEFRVWDLQTMESRAVPIYYIGFPDPFVYLRLCEQWLFYKDIRLFWLPSDYLVADRIPVILREDVLFCLGRIPCTFNISQTLPYFPSLSLTPLKGLDTFTIASVRGYS